MWVPQVERDGVLKCGLCVMKEMVKVKREHEKLKCENENLKHKVEVLKIDDGKRKEAGIYEKNENVKPVQPLPIQ